MKQNPSRPQTTTPIKTGSILSRAKPIEFDDNDGIKIALYGRSGTGKTTLWATFPKPILALILSGGKKPGELRSVNTKEYRNQIHSLEIDKLDDLRGAISELKQNNPYATVVLDHATGLQDRCLMEILGLSEIPVQKGWGIAKQQEWAQVGLQTKEYLRGILGLSCNVVVIAQERNFNDDSTSDLITPTVGAALSPSTTGWLNSAVDYLANTFIRQKTEEVVTKVGEKSLVTRKPVKGVEYCLRTAPDPVFTTKFRVPKGYDLPDVIVDPTYEKIMEIIIGER
jgi:hypothetical protein